MTDQFYRVLHYLPEVYFHMANSRKGIRFFFTSPCNLPEQLTLSTFEFELFSDLHP